MRVAINPDIASDSGTLASLLPAELCWRLADSDTLPDDAFAASGDGAVMHVDVYGWRSVVELAAEQGSQAAAAVAVAWLSAACEMIARHGGDVVELGGDRIVAIWREETLSRAGTRAVVCALAVTTESSGWRTLTGARLQVAATVCSGDVSVNVLRDHRGQGFTVLAGDAVTGHDAIRARTRAGELLVDAATGELLGDNLQGDKLADGCLRVFDIDSAAQPEPVHRPTVRDGAHSALVTVCFGGEEPGDWRRDAQLIAGASAMAVRLPALSASTDLGRTQHVFLDVSQNLAAVGAKIVDVRNASDGLTVTATLAANRAGAERSAAHAVLACERFVPAPRGARAACCFGVASGPLLRMTLLGKRSARVWLGEAVRLAAELAGRANAECLCDRRTARNAAAWVGFEAVGRWRPPATLIEVELHRPTGRLARPHIGSASKPNKNEPSEQNELSKQCRARLASLAKDRKSGILLLPCDADQRQTVANALLTEATSLSVRVQELTAHESDRLTCAAAWRDIADASKTESPQRFGAYVLGQLTRDTLLEANLVVVRGGEFLDAAAWRLALDVVAAVEGVVVAVIASVPGDPSVADGGSTAAALWLDARQTTASTPAFALLVDAMREASLHNAVATASGNKNRGKLVDQFAEQALQWRGWEDVVALSHIALREDWRSDGRLDHAHRRLRIGDAYRGMQMERSAKDAYRQGLKALGKEVGGNRLGAAMPKALTRITDRIVSTWRTTNGSPQEEALVDTLLDRMTNPIKAN